MNPWKPLNLLVGLVILTAGLFLTMKAVAPARSLPVGARTLAIVVGVGIAAYGALIVSMSLRPKK